jgi:hypothetical protein
MRVFLSGTAEEAAEKVDVGAAKRASGAKAQHILNRLRPD